MRLEPSGLEHRGLELSVLELSGLEHSCSLLSSDLPHTFLEPESDLEGELESPVELMGSSLSHFGAHGVKLEPLLSLSRGTA